MGLFDDEDDELDILLESVKKYPSFILDLNEGEVQAIFNKCLATKDDPTGEISSSKLFQKALGYDEDSKPVFFSKKRIEQNKKSIFYLLGQLRSAHNNLAITSTESIYRYDNQKWTSDTIKLMELYHLGECSNGITPFVKKSNTAIISPALVKPTLSPKDPNFPAWWEQHKSEWEEPKKEGQEPADD